MTDDTYLWDRSGKADPQLRNWETLLLEVRTATPLPHAPRVESVSRPLVRFRLVQLALAASVLLGVAAALWWNVTRNVGVALETESGLPTVAGAPIREHSEIAPGSVIETDSASTAQLRIGWIGVVQVGPSTRLQLLAADETHYRFAIRRGTVRADISAPPGVFVVETPFATAVDLGCEYDLTIDTAGDASLTVGEGWVEFESVGRQSLVPEGARAVTHGRSGVGSPYYLDASPAFISGLASVDFIPEERDAALAAVLIDARRKDSLTLLTLLRRLDAEQRLRVHDRLRVLLPPPDGVTREGIGAGDTAMIDLWWKALGLKFNKKPPVAVR